MQSQQMSKMQEILTYEAKYRIQLEDRVFAAQEETERLRTGLDGQVISETRLRASIADLSARLDVAKRKDSQRRKAVEKGVTCSRSSQGLSSNYILAAMVSQTQHIIVDRLLAPVVGGEYLHGRDLELESVFGQSSHSADGPYSFA